MTSRHARLERVGKSNWLSRVDTMRTAIRKERGEAERGNRTQGCPLAAASGHLSSLLEPRPDSLGGLLTESRRRR